MRLKWLGQPDGISCGPTCLAMMAEAATPGGLALDVHHLGAMAGTNDRTGTTHEGIAVALAGLAMPAERVLGRAWAKAVLRAAPAAGEAVLCRTLTGGVKHWTVVDGKDPGGGLRYLDPAFGAGAKSVEEVLSLVEPRGYEVWRIFDRRAARVEVGPLVRVGSTSAERSAAIAKAVAFCVPEFSRYVFNVERYLDATVDWGLSRAVRVDGEVVGAYLLGPRPLPRALPTSAKAPYEGLRGVEGVALVVDPGLRDRGYGRLLRDEPRRMGFDFAWGMQAKGLNNVDRWLRHRELVHEGEGCWYTARAFARDLALVPADERQDDTAPAP